MRNLKEPDLRVFWDSCVWLCLFELSNESTSAQQINRRTTLLTFIVPMIESGTIGVIFSPCLLADSPKNVVLATYIDKLKQFENYGYFTVGEEVSDWSGIATLREAIRKDIAQNLSVFSHLSDDDRRRSVSLGDTAVIYSAVRTNADELWTYDPLLLSLSGRSSVRNLKICEPNVKEMQATLAF